ncbi:hypothetical protein HD806DRAFT_541470 [Xylariaceae sp. AK1471]|nr:hypothetical protein HD806DRAFT_541470 [Xylariaceae sp. AK1471]
MSSATNNTANLAWGYPVHLGLWTNWSRGRVLGATLTVTREDATLLIAFTSTFIAFVATRVWRSFCFFLHRCYSTSTPQDAAYHQLQAILRNSSVAEDGLQLSLNLLSTKHKQRRYHQRILLVILVGLLLVVSFTIIGGFSSRIATSDNEVLIESARCGYLYGGKVSDEQEYYNVVSYMAKKTNNAANYAEQCYSDAAGQFDCDNYVVQRINSSVDMNATCPFDSRICLNNGANIRIDSGYINSHILLGLNAPTTERILWRNVLHCAPLATNGFTSQDSQSLTNDTLFHYGNYTSLTGNTDYVYRVHDLASQYGPALSGNGSLSYLNYRLNAFSSYILDGGISEGNSDFMPTGALTRKDADIHLVMLSGNGVVFTETTDDPWYNVSRTTTNLELDSLGNASTVPVHLPGAPASPLACTNQHQFCNTKKSGSCGPLASLRDAIADAAPLFNTSYGQIANNTAETEEAAQFTYFTATFITVDRSIAGILGKLGPTALLSQDNLFVGILGTLASNQRQLDVAHWWAVSMAMAQEIFLDSAYGSSDPALLELRVNFTTPEFDTLCQNQKIKTTAFISFSLFGLIFTYVVGILLAVISYSLEPVSKWFHKQRAYGQYKHLEWTTNATLQLQRLAHEGIRQGTWSKGTDTTPTTEKDELLGLLDISNLEYPVLRPLEKTEESPSYCQPIDENTEIAIGDIAIDDAATPARDFTTSAQDDTATLAHGAETHEIHPVYAAHDDRNYCASTNKL